MTSVAAALRLLFLRASSRLRSVGSPLRLRSAPQAFALHWGKAHAFGVLVALLISLLISTPFLLRVSGLAYARIGGV